MPLSSPAQTETGPWRLIVRSAPITQKLGTAFVSVDDAIANLGYHDHPETDMPKATYGTVAGIAGPISRIVRGAVLPGDDVESKAVLDTFYDAGGNCFDTAFIYHDGYSERFLGCWVERRNIRDDVVVIGKGAHTPNCDPVSMRNELSVSLERLRTDYVDLYMLHSDDLAVPVGEFVEALNEEVLGGRVRAFGASNWSMARLDAAVTSAQTRGLIPFSVLSNHFSLATMGDPPWEGCLDSADAAFVEWLTVHQLPDLPGPAKLEVCS